MKSLVKFLLNFFPRTLLISISNSIKPILNFVFTGSRFRDPINNKSYSYFFPYGYNIVRSFALSPGTFSLERHRLLWLYLKKETNFFNEESSILHVAPEQCFYSNFKSHFKKYITFDLESPLADIKGDICNLPFNDNQFDYILCNHVLEHVYDDQMAMNEIFRVLKKGGIAILQVPIDYNKEKTLDGRDIDDKKLRNKLFGQYDHLRMYGKDYFKKLNNTGFRSVNVNYLSTLTQEEITKFSIKNAGTIPVCFKD